MRRIFALATGLALLTASACFGDSDPLTSDFRPDTRVDASNPPPDTGSAPDPMPVDDPWAGAAPTRADVAACDPGADAFDDMLALYRATDDSVHELITCGGAQVGLAQRFVARILFSQPDAFDMDEDTKRILTDLLGNGSSNAFVRDATGDWLMSSSANGRFVEFAITFSDGETPITIDPLRLDSYLVGAYVAVAHSFEEMSADWDLVNTYTFTYEGPGPLAHLLNDGAPLPASFSFQMSLWDIIYLYIGAAPKTPIDFGPLASLGDVAMTSSGNLVEDRDGISIAYDFAAGRSTVSELGQSRSLPFHVEALTAAFAGLDLVAITSDLRYDGKRAGLAGVLRYRIAGGAGGEGGDISVSADFGEGSLYPVSTWSCAAP